MSHPSRTHIERALLTAQSNVQACEDLLADYDAGDYDSVSMDIAHEVRNDDYCGHLTDALHWLRALNLKGDS